MRGKGVLFILVFLLAAIFLIVRPSIQGFFVTDRPTVLFASWNIENFGVKKASNETIMSTIATTIAKYDLITIQEVSNVLERVDVDCSRNRDACPGPKCHLLEGAILRALSNAAPGHNFSILVSPQVRDERYVFVVNTDRIRIEGTPSIVYDSEETGQICDVTKNTTGLMIRQPFEARVSIKSSESDDIVIWTTHTSPTHNHEELDGLGTLFERASSQNKDVLLMGDLNADCSYISASDATTLRRYAWLISSNDDTTATKSSCAYDNMIVTPALHERVAKSGVDRSITEDVSDHYPIWVSLYADE